MIRVTIELDSAITGETTTLGVMHIANIGSGTKDKGNYNVAVFRKDKIANARKHCMPTMTDVARTGTVENYPRLAYNVWRLIARALLAAFPEERK